MKTSMIGYFIQCLTTKYCCFSGRARRKEIWSFYIIGIILMFGFFGFVLRDNIEPNSSFYLTQLIISAVVFLPVAGLNVRRLHDVGMSGVWALPSIFLQLISIYSDILSLNNPFETTLSAFAFIWNNKEVCCIYGLYIFIIAIVELFFGSQSKENKYGAAPLR